MSATELPPLPEPVESGSMNCEDCGGSGNDGEETYQGEFQPPEAGPCQSCGGSGRWALPLFTRDQMRDYALQANVDLAAESERNRVDAERYRWLRERLLGADFYYGEPPKSVLTFMWPEGARISADLDASIDAAAKDSP